MTRTERARMRRLQRILDHRDTDDRTARTFARIAVATLLFEYEGRRLMGELAAEISTGPGVAVEVKP